MYRQKSVSVIHNPQEFSLSFLPSTYALKCVSLTYLQKSLLGNSQGLSPVFLLPSFLSFFPSMHIYKEIFISNI